MGGGAVTSIEALALLQRIYGAHVPADSGAALAMLETSPYAPTDAGEAAALRALVLAAAGQGLEGMRAAAERLTAQTRPLATTHKPLGGLVKLQLEELSRRGAAPAPVISEARAAALFAELAAAPDIPHDFVDEGCHYRAHVIARRLEEAGVASEKIVLSPTAGDLRIDSAKAALGFTIAMFHVATVVNVRTTDGRIERRVLDPSLCDGPATIDAWAATMRAVGGAPCEISFLPRFALMPWQRDQPPADWRAEELAEAQAWNEQYREVQRSMQESGFYDYLRELASGGGGNAGAPG